MLPSFKILRCKGLASPLRGLFAGPIIVHRGKTRRNYDKPASFIRASDKLGNLDNTAVQFCLMMSVSHHNDARDVVSRSFVISGSALRFVSIFCNCVTKSEHVRCHVIRVTDMLRFTGEHASKHNPQWYPHRFGGSLWQKTLLLPSLGKRFHS